MKTKGKFKLKIPLHCCSVNSAMFWKEAIIITIFLLKKVKSSVNLLRKSKPLWLHSLKNELNPIETKILVIALEPNKLPGRCELR